MARIVVNYGKDIINNTVQTLCASDIDNYLRKEYSVAVKPNLVVASPASGGATTHPEVVEGIIIFLKEFGVSKIKIIEGSWVGDSTKRAFKNCGYEKLAAKYDIPIIDLKNDSHTIVKSGGYSLEICNEALNADFLINVPVLKAHCQTRFTCCMKNLKGCITDAEKRRFHTLGIHKPVAALNAALKTGYCVVDGICGDLSFEEGGNPVEADRIIAGRNPLTVDSYCCGLIGYEPADIDYISYGEQLCVGEFFNESENGDELIELNIGNKPLFEPKSSRAAAKYAKYIEEDSACSACYASLIHALSKLGAKELNALEDKIHIGQGYRGKTGRGAGVGRCANGFDICAAGCPPKASDIISMIKKI